jgi:flagellin-like protein
MDVGRKAISPLISAVIVIAIVFALAVMISPWMFEVTRDITNQTTVTTETHLKCQNAAFDFDTGYGAQGVDWNFTGTDSLKVKVKNTGSINMHSFSFEVVVDTAEGGLEIKEISINETVQKTLADPLKPGRSAVLEANFTEDINGTLKELKVLNDVCPTVSVSQII